MKAKPVVLDFTNVLWIAIAAMELFLVSARIFMAPGPLRLFFALLMPILIILGALANAIYNRIKIGHALDDLPPAKRQ